MGMSNLFGRNIRNMEYQEEGLCWMNPFLKKTFTFGDVLMNITEWGEPTKTIGINNIYVDNFNRPTLSSAFWEVNDSDAITIINERLKVRTTDGGGMGEKGRIISGVYDKLNNGEIKLEVKFKFWGDYQYLKIGFENKDDVGLPQMSFTGLSHDTGSAADEYEYWVNSSDQGDRGTFVNGKWIRLKIIMNTTNVRFWINNVLTQTYTTPVAMDDVDLEFVCYGQQANANIYMEMMDIDWIGITFKNT